MNKKGFTLAEIIGVIVIIGLLLLLISPLIINRIKNKSDKTNDAENKLIIYAAEQYIDENEETFPSDGQYCIPITTLVNDGKLVSPVTDIKTGNNLEDDYSVLVTINEYGNKEYNLYKSDECIQKNKKPLPQITGGKDTKKNTQTFNLSCSDETGLVGYYFGKNNSPSDSDYIRVNGKKWSGTNSVNSEGTYYLKCKSSNGEVGTTTVKVRSLKVHNMLLNLDGEKGKYSSNNYTRSGNIETYLIKSGVNLKSENICSKPTEGADKLIGYNLSEPKDSIVTISNKNLTVNSNKTVSCWYDREEFTVKVTKPIGRTIKVETINQKNNSLEVSPSSNNLTLTVRYGDKVKATSVEGASVIWSGGYISGTDNPIVGDEIKENKTITATPGDSIKPSLVITGGTSQKSKGQELTIKCTDEGGVTAYYFGTTNPTASDIKTTTDLDKLQNNGINKSNLKNGTYYLGCKDSSGNFDITSIVIRKYVVNNLLESLSGKTGTYTNTNYAIASSETYYIKDGENINLESTFTIPEGGIFKGYSTGYSNSASNISLTNPKVASNDTTNYYMWFDRNTYKITIPKQTNGSIKAETVTQANNSVVVDASSKELTVKHGDTVKLTATPSNGYSLSSWSGDYVSGVANPITGPVVTGNKTVSAIFADTSSPEVSDISGGTALKATSQTLTLKAIDNVGIVAYYFGSAEPTSANAITTTTDLEAISGSGLNKTINKEGTYWFAVKDAAGNYSKKSIVIRKYQVQNILEKIEGKTGTYTNANYETVGNAQTYYIKDGTTLTLANTYIEPTGASADTFKGYTTSSPSTTNSSLNTTAPKVSNNMTVYYMWFNRTKYKVTVTKPSNGSIKAETVIQTENSITVTPSSSADGSLNVKYGDTVKATATPNTNSPFEGWEGGYLSGTTNPKTGSVITENKTITAKFKLLPVIKYWGYNSSEDFHESSYRNNITSVIFENNINVPNGATSWDVSSKSNPGLVIAWITADPEDSTKYVLHIGAEGGVIANPNSSYIFRNFTNVKSISFNNNYDASNATDMSSMFESCSNLTSLDLGAKFDTSSVKNMSRMFHDCSSLTNLDLGDKFDTSSVTYMNLMFSGCSNLTSLDLKDKFDTSDVTNMYTMFAGCNNLTSLDLGDKFDTSSVTDMGSMFESCSNLTSLDLGDKFDTSSVKSMSCMFLRCSSLTSLDLGDKFDTSNVTGMYRMFEGCNNLTSLDLGDKYDTSKVTRIASMFANCNSLTSLDLGNKFDTSSVNSYDGMESMFSNCSSLTSLDLGDKFDTSSVTTMQYMFDGCSKLTSLDLGDKFDTSSVKNMRRMFSSCSSLTSLDLKDKFDTSSATNMGYMFSHCSNLTSLDLKDKFDTSNVTTMQHMFSVCSSLTSLDLGDKFDTSNVTNMNGMFHECNSIPTIELGDKFDTSSATDMSYMFYGCSSLTDIDLKDKFDTSSVTNMRGMFSNCSSLTSLDLCDKFDTSNVTNMNGMFSYCSNLTDIDLKDKFDTSNVTDMNSMFAECSSLISLDLKEKFNTSNVTNMQSMFFNCTNLETIFVPESFVTTNVDYSASMFTNDMKLVGGNGTKASTFYFITDKTYAKIDKPEQTGYFTKTITTPKFTEAQGSNNSVDVTITFPDECGSELTCKYKKNNGSYVTVTNASVTVNFTASGTLSATVTDGTYTKSASYTVIK